MARIKAVFSIGSMHGGGAERQLVSLLRHLDRNRFEPFLYLVDHSGPLLAEVPADVTVTAFESRNTQCPSRFPGAMHRRRVSDMSQFLCEVGADVSYDRTFLMTLIAADAAQRVGVPNVSTIVTDPHYGFRSVAGRFQTIKRRRLHRLYSQSTCVVANSEGAARSAETFYDLTPQSVVTLYNGVDIDAVREKSTAVIDDPWWNAPPPPGKRVFRLATAGRLNREKGFHLLVAAVARLRQQNPEVDFRLAILGEGAGRHVLEMQVAEGQLQNSVRLPGFRSDAPAWYRSADLFVLPSYFEGLPNVLLEAMVCETAVLSSDCPSGPSEILEAGRFGELFPTGDIHALVVAIQKFVTDESHATRYTAVAADRVRQSFFIATAAGRLADLLESAVARRRSE